MKPQGGVSVSGDTLLLTGAVVFNTVAGLKQQLDLLPVKEIRRLDCSGITLSDSAAVSLLLYLSQDNAITLQGVNASLQGLLDLYEVATFFTNEPAQ